MNKIEITSVTTGSYRTSEAFKTLRTNLQFSGPDIKCIAITSCLQNEGKSLISVELAKSLSEIGKKVIVIDTDMRKSVLTLRYKVESSSPLGLSQYLTNQATLEDIIFETQYPNLKMILAGKYPPNPVELLYTDKFKELLAKCREEYDYIIVDTTPLGAVIDAAVIAQRCDGAIMVISAGKIKYRIAANVKKQLEKANCQILGAILNYTDSGRFSSKGEKYTYYYKRTPSKHRLGFLNSKNEAAEKKEAGVKTEAADKTEEKAEG